MSGAASETKCEYSASHHGSQDECDSLTKKYNVRSLSGTSILIDENSMLCMLQSPWRKGNNFPSSFDELNSRKLGISSINNSAAARRTLQRARLTARAREHERIMRAISELPAVICSSDRAKAP